MTLLHVAQAGEPSSTVFVAVYGRREIATFFSFEALKSFVVEKIARQQAAGIQSKGWVSSPTFAPTIHGYRSPR